MGLKYLKDAVYSEKYTNKDGEEKTKYTNVGALFEREDGSMCVKFLGSWINFYEKKMPAEGYQKAKEAVKDDLESEIPF